MPRGGVAFFQGREPGRAEGLSPTAPLVDAGAVARVETRVARDAGHDPPLVPALLAKMLFCERMGWTLSEYDEQDAHELSAGRALLRGWDGAA